MKISVQALLLLVLAASAAYAQAPARPASTSSAASARVKITIGKDTSFVDGPVNADGTINYLAAFNARLAQGVTPQNNAAVALLKAFGPELVAKVVRDQTLKEIGVEALPEKGAYFVTLSDWAKDPKDPKDSNKAWEDRAAAMKKPWQAKDYPELAAWLQANEKPLGATSDATWLRRFYIPMLSPDQTMIGGIIPRLTSVRDAGRGLCARAMLRFAQNDLKGARADLLAVHRLARLIGQQEIVISLLVGISMDSMACDTEAALAGLKLTAADAKAMLADLDALPALPKMSVAVDRGERFSSLDFVMMMARASLRGRRAYAEELRGLIPQVQTDAADEPNQPLPVGKPEPDLLDWNGMLRLYNQWYDRYAAADALPTFKARNAAHKATQDDFREFKAGVKPETKAATIWGYLIEGKGTKAEASKATGELMVAILFPSLGMSELPDKGVEQLELTKVALALAAYRADKGQFPDALSALAPAYMKEVPKDLFTDGTLVYTKTAKGCLLYSLGPNMKDDGGKTMAESPESYDIVVRAE